MYGGCSGGTCSAQPLQAALGFVYIASDSTFYSGGNYGVVHSSDGINWVQISDEYAPALFDWNGSIPIVDTGTTLYVAQSTTTDQYWTAPLSTVQNYQSTAPTPLFTKMPANPDMTTGNPEGLTYDPVNHFHLSREWRGWLLVAANLSESRRSGGVASIFAHCGSHGADAHGPSRCSDGRSQRLAQPEAARPSDPCIAAGTCPPGTWIDCHAGEHRADRRCSICGNYGTKTVQVDPLRPGDVYTMFMCQGVWKSSDYGQTWSGPINTGQNGMTVGDCANLGHPPPPPPPHHPALDARR